MKKVDAFWETSASRISVTHCRSWADLRLPPRYRSCDYVEARRGVTQNLPVSRHQLQIFHNRLRNQDPVERIFVVEWQSVDSGDMPRVQR